MITSRDRLSDFQGKLRARLMEILQKHGASAEFEEKKTDSGGVYLLASFAWEGRACSLEIYADSAVMLVNGTLYESYLGREFKDQASLVASFAERVDHYLATGEWRGQDEIVLHDRILGFFRGRRSR